MKAPLTLPALLACVVLTVVSCKKDIQNPNPASLNGPAISSDAVVTNAYYITPKVTDPNITTALSNHFVSVQTGGTLKNVLYVFLPGTYRNPTNSRATTEKAASLGYHAIGLMYDNLVAGNPLCKTTGDITCHSRARREVIDGIDRHPSVNVNVANSLINRLTKLLIYLNKTRPTQGWAQYLVNGAPNWSKIMVAGHSQGGAVAGVIGRYYPVKKVIMISMMDFLNNGKIPDWVALQTRKERYYHITNTADELVPYAKVKIGWEKMGMTAYGARINVDWNASPYSNTHTLITQVVPSTTMTDKFHNSTGVDSYIPKNSSGKYIYDKAWEYLLNK